MTAIADADLQRLFDTFAKANARAALDVEREPDNAYDWGSSEARAAFIAALNERLEAAERMYEGLRWMYGYYNAKCNGKEDLHAAFLAYDAAYRQSKERT